MLLELVAAGASINGMSPQGVTPLHAAARYDNVTAVGWLLRHDADLDAKDNKGWTALHHAIAQNSAQAGEVLLAHGASANLIFPEDNNSGNATEIEKCQGSLLYHAAKRDFVRSVTVLLPAGASTSYTYKGVYPIERAVSAGGWNVVEAFLSHYKETPSVAVPITMNDAVDGLAGAACMSAYGPASWWTPLKRNQC
ncbi:Ankyrin repeat domain-containing protein 52 [Trebouxia sp. C0009 RCD-2024]